MENPRHTVTNLKDLLPEVLIEAQGCDEITALAALRRAYEKLCISHGFDERTIMVSCRPDKVEQVGHLGHIKVGEQNMLRILNVERVFKDNGKRNIKPCPFDQIPGGFAVPMTVLFADDDSNLCFFRVTMTAMPDLDGKIYKTEKVTKWRNLLVAVALKDLFSMEGQPWASGARLSHYTIECDQYLSAFAITEGYYGSENTHYFASAPASTNVFC